MRILTKQKNFELLEKGAFGNKLRLWSSLEELLESDYQGTVSMRYKGSWGGGFCQYNVDQDQIQIIQQDWIEQGAKKDLITFNESAPDHKLLLQGELLDSNDYGFCLFYSTEKKKMRDALRSSGQHVQGLIAKINLQHLMTPSSYEDMNLLINQFPDHVIEFSTYSIYLGELRGRNTVVWEVRKY